MTRDDTLDIEADIARIKPAFAPDRPRIVSFHAAAYGDLHGRQTNLIINVRVENGDVYGILDSVAENGGVGAESDGVYRFIPWPCAAVEVRDA